MSVGVPIKVLHDAEGHIVTLETVNGEVFRGKLVEAEDNMNVRMADISMTARDGRTSNLSDVYIRGSKIRPEGSRGAGAGRGKSAMIRSAGNALFFPLFFIVRGRSRPFRARGGPSRGPYGRY
ncbi:unnamed protein product [Protopolystoma xenopodis]|uniref:Small nuclear ribonucleoprotein Sm D3 n=1 Tax=Protopolystoma xenopodis TaxID=117903 RepID=A0A448WBJ5_9PLAT|nr:unnamed protein product [Protopolystoma xenopodis]